MDTTLPADRETEQLAKSVATATGKPLSVVVKEAIEEKAALTGVKMPSSRSTGDLFASMLKITDAFAKLPILDDRSADEIVRYDAQGLAK